MRTLSEIISGGEVINACIIFNVTTAEIQYTISVYRTMTFVVVLPLIHSKLIKFHRLDGANTKPKSRIEQNTTTTE